MPRWLEREPERSSAAADATGAVAVDGQTVTVTVTDSVDYYLLPGSGSVSAAASSVPSRGVQSGSVDP